MEPIPETTRAVEELGPFVADDRLLEELVEKSERVRAVVPECIALSLASTEYGVTFTLVASSVELAVLDAVQYVTSGPCLEAAETGQTVAFSENDVLDEDRWRLFASAADVSGVASTLTLPILDQHTVTGTVNLYAASADAFDGRHEPIADIFGAWASGAVANADMSFSSRLIAQQAPHLLREETITNEAASMVVDLVSVPLEAARVRIREAAARAGVSPAQFAEALISFRHG